VGSVSHWAELNENNKVIRVLVGDNNDANGDEGYQWLIDNLGGTWIKASYNGNIRFNYPGMNFTYDPIDDAFIAPMPECGHDELLLNDLKRWECVICAAELAKRLESIENQG
jgi:hypothetical protein